MLHFHHPTGIHQSGGSPGHLSTSLTCLAMLPAQRELSPTIKIPNWLAEHSEVDAFSDLAMLSERESRVHHCAPARKMNIHS